MGGGGGWGGFFLEGREFVIDRKGVGCEHVSIAYMLQFSRTVSLSSKLLPHQWQHLPYFTFRAFISLHISKCTNAYVLMNSQTHTHSLSLPRTPILPAIFRLTFSPHSHTQPTKAVFRGGGAWSSGGGSLRTGHTLGLARFSRVAALRAQLTVITCSVIVIPRRTIH